MTSHNALSSSQSPLAAIMHAYIVLHGNIDASSGAEAVVCAGIVRGCGRQSLGAKINLISYWVLGTPLCYTLAFKVGLGVQGLWWGLTIATTFQVQTQRLPVGAQLIICHGHLCCCAIYADVVGFSQQILRLRAMLEWDCTALHRQSWEAIAPQPPFVECGHFLHLLPRWLHSRTPLRLSVSKVFFVFACYDCLGLWCVQSFVLGSLIFLRFDWEQEAKRAAQIVKQTHSSRQTSTDIDGLNGQIAV